MPAEEPPAETPTPDQIQDIYGRLGAMISEAGLAA
jgi:hypothetical protein